MHGSPLFRVLALTVLLAVAGVIVSVVARSPKSASQSGPLDAPVTHSGGVEAIPLHLSIQLSAPATSLSLSSADTGNHLIPPHHPEALTLEFRAAIEIHDGSSTALLNIEWESPSENRFVRIVAEPDVHETRELVLHAPVNLENHAITFEWPSLEDSGL